ncbi:MAG: ATP-binding protein, partial [Chitinophagaceae bacterium]
IDIVGKGPGIEGMTLREAMPELTTEEQPFLRILDEVFTSGTMFQTFGSQVKIVQNGVMTFNYYNFTYTPLLNNNGEVYAILDIAIDVTRQIEAQKKLEDTEMNLREAIELAELGTWNIDAVTRKLNFSDQILKWCGADPESNEIEDVYSLILETDRQRIETAVIQTFKAGIDGRFDEKYTLSNKITGRKRFIHAIAKVITDEEGKPLRLQGTAQDITMQHQAQMALEQQVQQRTEELASAIEELRATNEELARTNDELQEANQQLTHSNDELAQYAYVASHDLQEPLRKIRFFSDLLSKEKSFDPESQVVIKKIDHSAKRMSQLILDLLNFSRLLMSESLIQQVDLMEIIKAVENDFELTITETKAVITIGELPVVEGVSLQMNQLFFNLLSNALKFVKPGTSPRISIQSSRLSQEQLEAYVAKPLRFANYYSIEFSDNGIGFEAQYADQIFEVFKRLHGRDIYPGSGIGLSLCKRILNNHNGQLLAKSVPGQGSTFQIIIPDRQQASIGNDDRL